MGLIDPYFREAGSGPAVVCIHAGFGTSGQWRPLMERLAGQFRVIACDMSNSGKSGAIPRGIKYTLDEEVAFLGPIFRTSDNTFHLVGHSFGGAVADLGTLAVAATAFATGGLDAGAATAAAAGARPTGASAFTNLICELA